MTYYANFNANNGTRLMNDIFGSNKKDLLRRIRRMAMAERFQGNSATWWVCDEEGNSVYEQSYHPHVGTRYLIRNYKSLY